MPGPVIYIRDTRHSLFQFAVEQIGDLFGNQPDKKYEDRGNQQQSAHIRETGMHEIRIKVITQPQGKEGSANRYEELKGRVQCADAKNDQQETHAITDWPNMTLPLSHASANRDIPHWITGPEKRHSDCRRV